METNAGDDVNVSEPEAPTKVSLGGIAEEDVKIFTPPETIGMANEQTVQLISKLEARIAQLESILSSQIDSRPLKKLTTPIEKAIPPKEDDGNAERERVLAWEMLYMLAFLMAGTWLILCCVCCYIRHMKRVQRNRQLATETENQA